MPHALAEQSVTAWAAVHTLLQVPQLRGSEVRLYPSSMGPSQSLSRPSHSSKLGPVAPTHWMVPDTQW